MKEFVSPTKLPDTYPPSIGTRPMSGPQPNVIPPVPPPLTSKPDMVNHPPHYQSSAGLEVIDVIKAFTENLKGIEATDTGNILKYACRWKEKNGIEDLEKIVWYTQHLIEHLKNEKENN